MGTLSSAGRARPGVFSVRTMGDDGKWALRNELIERARRGELTGEQADAEAERLGVGPLLRRADPAGFDPTAEPHWDIPMALGWIMTSNVAAVREVWQRWRDANEFWFWREERCPDGVMAGHWIARQGHVGLMALTLLQAQWVREGRLKISRADAEARLMNDLASGRARAWGLPSSGGARVLIASHEWRDLRLFEERERIVVRTENGIGPGYNDVVLWREEIVSPQESGSGPVPACKLPTTPWLRLQHATTFALYGYAWHRDFNSLSDVSQMRRGGVTRDGSVLHKRAEDQRVGAQNEFDRRLSEAAFAQQIVFKARRKGYRDADHERVDHEYFKKHRGFSDQGDWIERLPHGTDDSYLYNYATRDDDEWEDALVEREGFVAWLCEAYPQTRVLFGWPVERSMLQPILAPGMAGYVPLCSALHWLMTQRGTVPCMVDDETAWNDAVSA
jgi:hypothetical protein